jgi:hypothetical protein
MVSYKRWPIYIYHLEGFITQGKENHVCLKRIHYIDWNSHQDSDIKGMILFMLGNCYFISDYDNCVYFRKLLNGLFLCLLLYVDDMLITSKNMYSINNLKDQLSAKFEMKDLGAKTILGIRYVKIETLASCFCHRESISNKYLNILVCMTTRQWVL